MKKSVVIVGDGWAALGAAAFVAKSGQSVTWIKGTGMRMLAPLPSLEVGEAAGYGVRAWTDLMAKMGIEGGELRTGSFLREFRNKAFREPAWLKAPTPETRHDVRNEVLWAPECRFVGAFEARFSLTLGEIEEAIRKELLSGEFPGIRRIEQAPVAALKIEENQVKGVVLGTGEEIPCEQFIYADKWSELAKAEGLPAALSKALLSSRKREPFAILQTVFTHKQPVGQDLLEGFYATLNREAGEENDRRVWGYFTSGGQQSLWTVCLSHEEVEDNHEIAKKLRRMKTALDKMFVGTTWLPEGCASFMDNVADEQVRFEDALLLAKGSLEEIAAENAGFQKHLPNARFLTDGLGPSVALHQVVTALEMDRTYTQAEHVDLGTPAVL